MRLRRGGPTTAERQPGRVDLEVEELVDRIMSVILPEQIEGLPSENDVRHVLKRKNIDELRDLAGVKRLSHVEGVRARLAREIGQEVADSRQEITDLIQRQVEDLRATPKYEYLVDRILSTDVAVALSKVSIAELERISKALRDDPDKAAPLDQILRYVLAEFGGAGSIEYAVVEPDAEAELLKHLSDVSCLDPVRELLIQYGKASAQGNTGEQMSLARDIAVGLWGDIGLAEEAKQLLSVARRFERILDLVVARGHFLHQFETYLLGCLVLKVLKELLQKNNRMGVLGESGSDVDTTWLMASMFHDMGYPMQQGVKILTELCDMYEEMGTRVLGLYHIAKVPEICDIRELEHQELSSLGPRRRCLNIPDRIKNQILEGSSANPKELDALVADKWKQRDHGVIGAAMLWALMLKSHKVDPDEPSELLAAVDRASAAIALHDFHTEELEFPIEFEHLPYAFVLTVVDELQEWHRSVVSERPTVPVLALTRVTVQERAAPRVIDLMYELREDAQARWQLRQQISHKRNKLSNLTPLEPPQPCKGLEIHAHFMITPDERETVTVPVIHCVHGDN